MWHQSRSFLRRTAFLFVLIIPQMSFAWGELGHEMIANVGSQLTRTEAPFWKANVTSMTKLTTVPDVVWKTLSTADIEKPTHFFQPDSYFQDPSQFNLIPRLYSAAVAQFTQPFVDKNGTSVWRAQQFYNLAVQAIQANDFKTALELAGVMSHYIGDMSQPLHDTANFDGQMTGQTGIHAFFETTNIRNANQQQLLQAVGQQANALVNNPQFVAQFRGTMSDIVFNEVGRAYALKDTLLQIDRQYGRRGAGAQALLKLAEARMADGAATLAIVLTKLWIDAGNPSYGASVAVDVPAWVAPSYDGMAVSSSTMPFDDCSR